MNEKQLMELLHTINNTNMTSLVYTTFDQGMANGVKQLIIKEVYEKYGGEKSLAYILAHLRLNSLAQSDLD